jgi:5-methylcytosine-specific restriction enzyme subunit McrC
MKSVVIQKFEYQTLHVGEAGFTRAHFERLVRYNDLHHSLFLTIGHDRVTFKQFVGVIHIHDLTIEILPKIDRYNDDKASMRDLLVKMLHRTGKFPLERTESALLSKTTGSLFELYLRLFLQETQRLVAQGLPKHYALHRANEPFLKGRLRIVEQLKTNLIRKERNCIEYQRYSINHRFNQILKYALNIVANASEKLETHASNLLAHFETVNNATITAVDFRKLRYTRNTECYRTAMTLAELIITGFQPDIKHGSLNIIAFLFDMNLLFEKYVMEEIRRAAHRLGSPTKVKSQVSKTFWRQADLGARKMIRPDIVIEMPDHTTFVLDTKWKILQDAYSNDNDLKQLYTYSLQFESSHVFLLYPTSAAEHQFVHGHFQATQGGKIHNTRHVTQWKIPLLDPNGRLKSNLGQDILSVLMGKCVNGVNSERRLEE